MYTDCHDRPCNDALGINLTSYNFSGLPLYLLEGIVHPNPSQHFFNINEHWTPSTLNVALKQDT